MYETTNDSMWTWQPWEKKNKGGEQKGPTIIKTLWYRQKNTQKPMEQNGEYRNKPTFIRATVSTMDAKICDGERKTSSINSLGTIGEPLEEKWN